MRTAFVAVVLALAAAPAFGQQQSPNPSTPSGASASQQSSAGLVKLRDSLEQGGFQQIDVVDVRYLVHARNSDGSMIVMYVDPPAPVGAPGTTEGGPVADRAQLAMTKSRLLELLQKAGFSDIKIVDAAYAVKAATSDGGQAMIYVNSPAAEGGSAATTGQSGPSASPNDKSK